MLLLARGMPLPKYVQKIFAQKGWPKSGKHAQLSLATPLLNKVLRFDRGSPSVKYMRGPRSHVRLMCPSETLDINESACSNLRVEVVEAAVEESGGAIHGSSARVAAIGTSSSTERKLHTLMKQLPLQVDFLILLT